MPCKGQASGERLGTLLQVLLDEVVADTPGRASAEGPGVSTVSVSVAASKRS